MAQLWFWCAAVATAAAAAAAAAAAVPPASRVGPQPWSSWSYTADPSRDELRIHVGDDTAAAVARFCSKHGMLRPGTNGPAQCDGMLQQLLANYPRLAGEEGEEDAAAAAVSYTHLTLPTIYSV